MPKKNWLTFTEVELATALRLDPEDDFAKETIARLLFKLPDRKSRGLFRSSLHRQVIAMAAGFFAVSVILATGIPQSLVSSTLAKVGENSSGVGEHSTQQGQKDRSCRSSGRHWSRNSTKRSKIPQKQYASVQLKQFSKTHIPEKPFYDYTKQKPNQKTYYPEQDMVVVTYEDGSIFDLSSP